MLRKISIGACLLALIGCAAEQRDSPFASGDAGVSGPDDGAATDGADDGATSVADGGATGEGTMDDGLDDETGNAGPKLDVGNTVDLGADCVGDDTCEGCTYVDLLFVVDNSGSMGGHQEALGLAFPAFAETLAATLPEGTNLHVGVTSTEMAYSSQGSTMITNGACSFVGDGGQANDAFYVTPDISDSGRNGAQGRLYDPGGGQTYYDFDIGDDLGGLQDWFAAAINIGEGGSNVEMATAPVAWVADPANGATNDGFIRDEGAVLVVFFLQDEPDQTPLMIDGQSAGSFTLERLAAAKAGCGGTDCIIAGGFLEANACSADGDLPLDEFLAGVGASPVVSSLPPEGNPAAAAAQMNETLSTTLADIIASTCQSIPPAG